VNADPLAGVSAQAADPAVSHPAPVIRVEHAVKRFSDVVAIDDVSLDIYENEFFALLGPSGCGKTTLLRSIGGFEELSSGSILLDGDDLVGTRPYERPVNMMFQSYALFPHMKVWDNVAYGLRAEKAPKAEIASRVEDVLAKVDMLQLADRRPNQLSGGQRQRVALARAIVKRPRVLLLDEPLAALDRKLRQEMQIELKRLQLEVGLTFVVVTHDQEEAMTMADRIAVMHAGKVLQVATPQELYASPVDHFVAAFIGTMNFLPATVVGSGTVNVGRIGALPSDTGGHGDGDRVWIAVRPERMSIARSGAPGGAATVTGVIEGVAFVGSLVHTHVLIDGGHGRFVVTAAPGKPQAEVGSRVSVEWDPAEAAILPR
jgi:spermidine/putrescine ABC transporter ATP-binding subunit